MIAVVKILGICGSPRNAATEYALREALKEAEAVPGVKTEFWTVRGKKIGFCVQCDRCIKEKSLCAIQDDYQELEQKMLEADGFLVASPVYDMSITAQLSACFNRTRPFYLVKPGEFRNRVGAGITLGGSRHGGQETALQPILDFFLLHEMLVTGGMGGSYTGGTVWTNDERAEGARADEVGMRTVRAVGRALAEAAMIAKLGRQRWDEEKAQLNLSDVEAVEDYARLLGEK